MRELKQVKIIKEEENKNPKFIKTKMITAEREDGVELKWDMIERHDSVHILVLNVSTNEFLFVEQVRIPVLVNDSSTTSVIECCAGLVDKDKDLTQIAIEEVQEELGYTPIKIKQVSSLKSAVGSAGNNSYGFFAIVSEESKISDGGGIETEDIKIFKVQNLQKFIKEYSFPNNNKATDSMTMFLATLAHSKNNLISTLCLD